MNPICLLFQTDDRFITKRIVRIDILGIFDTATIT